MCDDGGVTYLLGDMDLLSLDKEDENSPYTFEEGEKWLVMIQLEQWG